MRTSVFTAILPLLAVGAVTGLAAPGALPSASDDVPDLRGLLEPGWALQDRNGDGHVDFVEARIVLPAEPGEGEVAAAANLGARLAFESYGTDLNLVRWDGPEWGAGDGGAAGGGVGPAEGAPVFIVGNAREALEAGGLHLPEALADLSPGEGAVQRLPVSPTLPRGGAWVSGGGRHRPPGRRRLPLGALPRRMGAGRPDLGRVRRGARDVPRGGGGRFGGTLPRAGGDLVGAAGCLAPRGPIGGGGCRVGGAGAPAGGRGG